MKPLQDYVLATSLSDTNKQILLGELKEAGLEVDKPILLRKNLAVPMYKYRAKFAKYAKQNEYIYRELITHCDEDAWSKSKIFAKQDSDGYRLATLEREGIQVWDNVKGWLEDSILKIGGCYGKK
jgi:hypothetical protein